MLGTDRLGVLDEAAHDALGEGQIGAKAAAQGEVLLEAFAEDAHCAAPSSGQARATDRKASRS